MCTHMLHIFRDPRNALIMIRLRLGSLPSSFFHSYSFFFLSENMERPPFLFVRTREKVYARACHLREIIFVLISERENEDRF